MNRLLLMLTLVVSGQVLAKTHYNSQNRLPNDNYLADVTGDGLADTLVVDGANLFATRTSFEAHGLFYARMEANIERLFTGNFTRTDRENVCAVLADSTVRCFSASPDSRELWWSFSQPTFINAAEDIVVGDYNGDGFDDLLLYTSSTGAMRVLTRLSTGYFGPMPNFTLGNLSSPSQFVKKLIRVGEFHANASPRRDDLIFYDATTRQVSRYSARTEADGRATFWWSFTTNAVGSANDQIDVANVNGDSTDDVVLHNVSSGSNRFFEAEYVAGGLKPITNVSAGQLFSGPVSFVHFAKLKHLPAETGVKRDDALVFDAVTGTLVRSEARVTPTGQLTYWWAYTQLPLIPAQDQDGDGISTRHELGGYDRTQNGTSDVPLHLYGASPFGKDVFVEVDYMKAAPGESQSHVFKSEAVALAVQEMAKGGVNLHVFIDDPLDHQSNLGTNFSWEAHFDPIKDASFTRARWPFFHYCVFGDKYGTKGSSGRSRGTPGSDFIVTLGNWGENGSIREQAGTFLHELGHNLGLSHGGTDTDNYKPNHFSIMNYSYQFGGVSKDGEQQFLYSDVRAYDLDENGLDESRGVRVVANGSSYRTYVQYLDAWFDTGTAIDWSQNGSLSTSVAVDVNPKDSDPPPVRTVLDGSVNEYVLLQYVNDTLGSSSAGVGVSDTEVKPSLRVRPLKVLPVLEELTFEQFQRDLAPAMARLPPLDVSKLQKVLPVFQPLSLRSASKAVTP